MDIQVGDRVIMKKQHPCGGSIFAVKRIGMDFKLCCETCGHEIMVPRNKAEKGIKKVIKDSEDK